MLTYNLQLQVWDFSGQTNQLFVNDRKLSMDAAKSDEEVSIFFSLSVEVRNSMMSICAVSEIIQRLSSFSVLTGEKRTVICELIFVKL